MHIPFRLICPNKCMFYKKVRRIIIVFVCYMKNKYKKTYILQFQLLQFKYFNRAYGSVVDEKNIIDMGIPARRNRFLCQRSDDDFSVTLF